MLKLYKWENRLLEVKRRIARLQEKSFKENQTEKGFAVITKDCDSKHFVV